MGMFSTETFLKKVTPYKIEEKNLLQQNNKLKKNINGEKRERFDIVYKM